MLKTSSKLTISFIVYELVILVLFSFTVNIYYLYNWTSHSKDEIKETISKEYQRVYSSQNTDSLNLDSTQKFSRFKDIIMENGGYILSKEGKVFISKGYTEIPTTNLFSIFKKDGTYFLVSGIRLAEVGDVYLFYNTYNLYEGQLTLIRVNIIFLILFLIIGYFISTYLTRISLSNLKIITKFAKNLDFNNLKTTLTIEGPPDDEIKIIADTLNEAIKRINLKAEKLKEFSSDVAHEFKTSLMIMNSEIDYSIASKKYKESFNNIKIQVKFLDYLINSLLSLTRLENKKLQTSKTDISELVKQVISEAESIFEHKKLTTIIKVNNGVIKDVNESLFKIVINNLIFNAFKYTDSGTIEIRMDGDRFSIKDSGIGISKENIRKIWTRFFKEDKSRSDSGSHGLGLALVKNIVKKHKFKITVKSTKGEGSRFSIYF